MIRKKYYILIIPIFLFYIHNSSAQKKAAQQSLFRTPHTFSIESGILLNTVITSPPVQFQYLSTNTFLKSSYVVFGNWSLGAAAHHSYIVRNKLSPVNNNYPKHSFYADIFARYFFVGKHSGIYVEGGPSFGTSRISRRLDDIEYNNIYPFFKFSAGSMLKIDKGLYAIINYSYAFSLQKGYRSFKGLNIGLAYYFNRYYSEFSKPYKYVNKDKDELYSSYYTSAGIGYYPFSKDDFGTNYNLFMLNYKLGYNFNNIISSGLLSVIDIGKAVGVKEVQVFPSIGPYVQATFFISRPYTFNIHTGILFSDLFIPTEGLPYHSFVVYVPFGLGFSKKLNKIYKGLSFDLSFALNTAVGGKKRPEGNNSYYGLGLRYDFRHIVQ